MYKRLLSYTRCALVLQAKNTVMIHCQLTTLKRYVCRVHYRLNEEKVICYQLELGKLLADVLTEYSSCHQGKSSSW